MRTMNLMIGMLLHLMLISLTNGNHGSLKDCYSCSTANNGNNYMCDWGGYLPVNKVTCCSSNSSAYCKSSSKNICSNSFNEMDSKFFSFCPGINK